MRLIAYLVYTNCDNHPPGSCKIVIFAPSLERRYQNYHEWLSVLPTSVPFGGSKPREKIELVKAWATLLRQHNVSCINVSPTSGKHCCGNKFAYLGLVVQSTISANPGLNFNLLF